MNFWETLPRPFFVQAPMEDVTDAAFRQLIARFGKPASTRRGSTWRGGPDVMYTEFTSADGLVLAPEPGKQSILKKLLYSETERPIVAQLFSAIPERMEKAARLAAELGFDGIDINMGCPDRSIEKSGCGASLMKNPTLARELIRAAQTCGLPVSVKTRIGYNENELATWLPELLAENPAAVALHARTRKEMSDVPAHWDVVSDAVAIRDTLGSKALIIGNGDVKDLDDARKRVAETGCDGVMLGRAIYSNPWLYAKRETPPSPQEKIDALIEHIRLFDSLLPTSNFATMKKHFKAYIGGWDGSKELRVRLMETSTAEEAQGILSDAILST